MHTFHTIVFSDMLKLTDLKTYSVSTAHTKSMSMCNITWKDQVYLIVGKSEDANVGKFTWASLMLL